MVYNSIGEIKFAHVIFTAKFLETKIIIGLPVRVSDSSKIGANVGLLIIFTWNYLKRFYHVSSILSVCKAAATLGDIAA